MDLHTHTYTFAFFVAFLRGRAFLAELYIYVYMYGKVIREHIAVGRVVKFSRQETSSLLTPCRPVKEKAWELKKRSKCERCHGTYRRTFFSVRRFSSSVLRRTHIRWNTYNREKCMNRKFRGDGKDARIFFIK